MNVTQLNKCIHDRQEAFDESFDTFISLNLHLLIEGELLHLDRGHWAQWLSEKEVIDPRSTVEELLNEFVDDNEASLKQSYKEYCEDSVLDFN